MEMENVKVSYGKTCDSKGAIFKKRLSVKRETADILCDMVRAEGAIEKEPMRAMYLNTPKESKGKVIFLNLTQSRFIVEELIKCPSVSINEKRARVDCNTYLLIND